MQQDGVAHHRQDGRRAAVGDQVPGGRGGGGTANYVRKRPPSLDLRWVRSPAEECRGPCTWPLLSSPLLNSPDLRKLDLSFADLERFYLAQQSALGHVGTPTPGPVPAEFAFWDAQPAAASEPPLAVGPSTAKRFRPHGHAAFPPPTADQLDAEERVRIERKKQLNRMAAHNSRKRRMERIASLENEVEALRGENNRLSAALNRVLNAYFAERDRSAPCNLHRVGLQ